MPTKDSCPVMRLNQQFMLRRLFAAPDQPDEMVATSSRGTLPYLRVDGRRVSVLPATEAPRVRLPLPAIDVSWCPLKRGAEHAAFLTACTSQPLQLWDANDGELRASYVCSTDTGMHASPRCSLWLSGRAGALIAGGYGGFEDSTKVRVYDVMREGECAVFGYRTRHEAGPVCSLANGPCELLLAGFVQSGTVEAVDVRRRSPALLLRGLRAGVSSMRRHPTEEYLVYVGGRLGEDSVMCWDVRRCLEPLSQFRRQVHTHQVCDIAFVEGADNGAPVLVSATTGGGILTFNQPTASSQGGVVEGRCLQANIGVTSGIAALPNGRVAAVIGTRDYSIRGKSEGRKGSQCGKAAASYAEVAENEGSLAGMMRKRLRPSLEDGDSDMDECAASEPAASPQYTEDTLNVVVVSAWEA